MLQTLAQLGIAPIALLATRASVLANTEVQTVTYYQLLQVNHYIVFGFHGEAPW